ncbi:hypothetical protein [Mycobacterium hubeiense]|uniref:hypothetical protein n=1 Tax=Mycobacterium hubeiense TaxID=1867256 RepID=UPI000C7F6123|nr:hypothetical protein [Mycobacterium sp. QGD 101]
MSKALKKLRTELLTSALEDWVPLTEVETVISYFQLADSRDVRQELALRTIRSLVEDGLMEIGDLPTEGTRLIAWNLSLDEAMSRLRERYVEHYDEPAQWDFSIWLGLTESGERVAKELVDEART